MNRRLFYLFLFACTFLPFTKLKGQRTLPASTTTLLQKMQLEYIQPVEQSPAFIEKGRLTYFDYDFGLQIPSANMLILVQTRKYEPTYIPQVYISGLISTLATNNQEFDIRVMDTSNKYLQETNCDWAIESIFVPKKNMTDYRLAYLTSLFKEGVGSVNILYLSNEEIEVFPILRFLDY